MPRELTTEVLLERGVCKTNRGRDEPDSKYLARQTHLSLDSKRLLKVGAPLHACPLLQVLYLFDNHLETLDGLASTPHLTHLYVQNNQLVEGPELATPLGALRQLQKLYIGGNRLSDLAPLCVLPSLEELHAGGQRGSGPLNLPPELEQLQKLRVLLVPNNGLQDVSPLGVLGSLETLDLSGNLVADLTDIAPMLSRTPRLSNLDLRGCPLAKRRQMIDAVIVCGRNLVELNGREISASERPYLVALERKGRRTLSPSSGLRAGGPRVPRDPQPDPRGGEGLGASPHTGLGASPNTSQFGSAVSAGTLDSSPQPPLGVGGINGQQVQSCSQMPGSSPPTT